MISVRPVAERPSDVRTVTVTMARPLFVGPVYTWLVLPVVTAEVPSPKSHV